MEDLDIRFANANEASMTDHELLDVFFALHETFLAFTHGSIREEPAPVLRAVKELLPDFDETWSSLRRIWVQVSPPTLAFARCASRYLS
jgi:hypothetical protein